MLLLGFFTLITCLNARFLNDYNLHQFPEKRLNLPVNIDRDIQQVSNMVEEVNGIGEDWIWENTIGEKVDSQEQAKATTESGTTESVTANTATTTKMTEAPKTTELQTKVYETISSIARTIGCFLGRSSSYTDRPTTPTIPPSKPVTSDIKTTATNTEAPEHTAMVEEVIMKDELITERVTDRATHSIKSSSSSTSITIKAPTTEIKLITGVPEAPTALIKLCKNPLYKPPCMYVTESTPRLDELDDEVSSIKVYEGVWQLYTGSNYTGRVSWVRAGYQHPLLGVMQPDQGSQIGLMNDDLSSLRVFGKDSEALMMLCKNDRYNPPCINVTKDTPDLGLLDNEISAIKVYKGIWQLYSGKDFTGRKYWVSEGYEHPFLGVMKPDRGHNIALGNDQLSSLRVHYGHH